MTKSPERVTEITLHIIGLGVAEYHSVASLGDGAALALQASQLVIGSERQRQTVEDVLAPDQLQMELPKLSALPEVIAKAERDGVQQVSVLASGDPLFYGIGRWFGKHFPAEKLHFYPAVSSVQAACHQLGLSLQDVEVLSLHGRPLEKIRRTLKKNKTLVILTDSRSTPQALAHECVAAGFSESRLHVCEQLGYAQQQLRRFNTVELLDGVGAEIEFDPLHVTVIDVRGVGGVLPEFPGFADHAFITDLGSQSNDGRGLISKREVRLMILSLLEPGNDDVIWDVGAGCGGVAVELAYWNERTQVHAIEHHDQRLGCLAANRDKFGVMSNLKLVSGRAPQVLALLPSPNKVFIGGSDGELPRLLQQVWQQLPVGGLLVASAVTENTRQHLLGFYQQRSDSDDNQVQSTQLAVSRSGELVGQLLYRPNLPVTLFQWRKTAI